MMDFTQDERNMMMLYSPGTIISSDFFLPNVFD